MNPKLSTQETNEAIVYTLCAVGFLLGIISFMLPQFGISSLWYAVPSLVFSLSGGFIGWRFERRKKKL